MESSDFSSLVVSTTDKLIRFASFREKAADRSGADSGRRRSRSSWCSPPLHLASTNSGVGVAVEREVGDVESDEVG
jgi:hypothetical protein